MTPRASTRYGFTMIEMVAVIFLMSLVLVVAVNFYLDLSRAGVASVESTRDARRAVVLLDRVARDLEGAVMLEKPDDVDPIEFPWLFLAESESNDAGAERVKFIRRGHRPSASAIAQSDLEVVAFTVVPSASGDGALEVRRWSWPQLPESLDASFPSAEDSDLLADGLASFGIKFQGEDGAWVGRWDSTMLAKSSELPTAAEIEVSFRTGPGENDIAGPYTRQVLLPLRPIDLETQLAEAEGLLPGGVNPRDLDGDGLDDETGEPVPPPTADADADGGGEQADGSPGELTAEACLALHPEFAGLIAGVDPALVDSLKSQKASVAAAMLQFPVPADCR
jgi:prepilin-type N-terminal cleavage/methylation domain-containing protein